MQILALQHTIRNNYTANCKLITTTAAIRLHIILNGQQRISGIQSKLKTQKNILLQKNRKKQTNKTNT